jgi:UDP-N-acetylmuramate--alanine ligase
MKHIYLLGIGGAGMLWIADWALANGWQVSGSDQGGATAATKRLEDAGAVIHYGCDPSQIPLDVTEAVMTSAVTPSSPSYPELEELQKRGIPVVKRAVWIGKLSRTMRTIAISGTHGKTTTTAMVGWILEKAGLDPTVFVGGSVAAWGGRTRIGKSPFLVLEADEFDRSFHNFYPEISVVLNLETDHLDYYTRGLPEIEQSFHRFLRNMTPGKGILVAYGRSKSIRIAAKGFKYRMRWYDENHLWPGLQLQVPGNHNLLNATAAARVAHELGVSQGIIKEAMASFPGTGRRFEQVGTWDQAQWYDDYAHHPSEITATLQGAMDRFKGQNVTVVFQPHQKARTELLLKDFGRAFDKFPPTRLILAPIFEVAGREEENSISSADIARVIAQKPVAGLEVSVAATNEELQKLLCEAVSRPGILVTMGAGNIRSLAEAWRAS